MKALFNFLKFSSIFIMLFWISSCGEDTENKTTNNDTIAESVTDLQEDNLITYLIPSPKDMFAFTRNGNLKFSDNVLNGKENAEKYMDTKSLEVGFGIYSADLAYTAAFNQTGTAGEYLKIVEALSDKIGLGSVFSESLIARFKNIESKDSLMKVTNDTYYDIVKFLEENDRNTSLALISVGGWVESLYIVTSLQNKFKQENDIVQLIADQKNIFENLILSLQQRENEESIKTIIKELTPIKEIYDKLEVVKIEQPSETHTAKNQIVVGGTTKIVITEEQFNELKKTIAEVRNNLAGSNS